MSAFWNTISYDPDDLPKTSMSLTWQPRFKERIRLVWLLATHRRLTVTVLDAGPKVGREGKG